jgi:hypothetical protein
MSEDGELTVLLVLFGVLGTLACFVLFSIWNCVERAIWIRMKEMKTQRKEREFYLRMSQRPRRLVDAAQSRAHLTGSVVIPEPSRLPPSYEEAVARGEMKREDFFECLPSYEEAVGDHGESEIVSDRARTENV